MPYYKALTKDLCSWYDQKTQWAIGETVEIEDYDADPSVICGAGIHAGNTLLDAVSYQSGTSVYGEIELHDIVASDDVKTRARAATLLRLLPQEEMDSLAGFRLYEANNPVSPLLIDRDESLDLEALVSAWGSVRDSVRDSVRVSVWYGVGYSVRESVGCSVGYSVGDSVGYSVWDGVGYSVWGGVWGGVEGSVGAYIGGLFPGITQWCGVSGPDPWRPLLTLWYGGYVPSYDGTTWRLHAGPDAEVVWERG